MALCLNAVQHAESTAVTVTYGAIGYLPQGCRPEAPRGTFCIETKSYAATSNMGTTSPQVRFRLWIIAGGRLESLFDSLALAASNRLSLDSANSISHRCHVGNDICLRIAIWRPSKIHCNAKSQRVGHRSRIIRAPAPTIIKLNVTMLPAAAGPRGRSSPHDLPTNLSSPMIAQQDWRC